MKFFTALLTILLCVLTLSALAADPTANAQSSSDSVTASTKKGKPARPLNAAMDGQRGEIAAQILKELPPEDIERLRKLRSDSPEEFRKEMKKLVMKAKSKQMGNFPAHGEDSEIVKKISQEFKEAQDPARREQLKAQLKEEISKIFEKRMADNKEQLDKAEQRLEKLKDLYEKRKANADAIIEDRIRKLTTDKKPKLDRISPTPPSPSAL
jgi:predicted ribosome quality control (RQC) complex YloA/Tae2 family protein